MLHTTVRLPAEWEKQQFVQLVWPRVDSQWKDQASIHNYFEQLASNILRFEDLLICCFDLQQQQDIAQKLKNTGPHKFNYDFCLAPSNSPWARDNTPVTVYRDGQALILDFIFNAWGSKYAYDLDCQLVKVVHAQGKYCGAKYKAVDFVLEGGAIDSDGQGTLLTTESCLLNPNRNPQCSRADIENILQAELGVKRFLWLKHGGLMGDDTDGHIDMLARFVDPQTIVYMQCTDEEDPHYADLKAMEQELKDFRQANGEPYQLIPLRMPKAVYSPRKPGQRLPASYANFLLLNDAVLIPFYNDPADLTAQQTLQKIYPERTVVGLDSRVVIEECGSLHCLTMQLPVLS